MIRQQIEKMRKISLTPKEEIPIKDVFNTIILSFSNNKTMLDSYMKFEMGEDFDLETVKKIFQPSSSNLYGSINKPFINDYGRVSENMASYGIVGLKVDLKIMFKNYLEIIKVCLETRNSLIIKPYKKSKTLEFVIAIINDILIQTNDFNEIVLTDVELEKEDIDLLLYIGRKTDFNSIQTTKEKLFIGVGQYELLVDEVLDENLINFAKTQGVKIYQTQEDIYDKINSEGANYCTAIMSSNKEKIREFLSRIKSSYVLVNMSPTLVDNVNLFPEQLLKRKTVVILHN